jgi:hypothetical protein
MCKTHSVGHRAAFAQFVEKVCTSLVNSISDREKMFPLDDILHYGTIQKLEMTHIVTVFQSTIVDIGETINSTNGIQLGDYCVSEDVVTCKGTPSYK